MKYLFSIGLAGMFCCVALLMFWQAHVRGIPEGSGSLTAQLDELAAVWTAKNVPLNERVAMLVISDAESAGDPLALADQPSAPVRMKGWFRRAFLGESRAAADSRFARTFAGDQATVLWTQASFPTAEGEAMTRDIKAAIIKAHDAGAELDIVTQGLCAGPVLKAVQSLEGTVRGGEKVGVNKLVTVGMNWPTLNEIDPFFKFGRPENLREWAAIWTTNSPPQRSEIAIFSADANDALYPAEALYPSWSVRMEDVASVIKELIHTRAAMQRQLGQRAPASLKPPPKTLTWKNHQGFYSRKEVPAAGAPAAPASAAQSRDSLDMVTGGGGMNAPGNAPASGTEAPRPKYDGRHSSIELRLTRSKYSGFDLEGASSPSNMDAICQAEYPSNPPAVLYSKLCDTNPSSSDPLLDEYPEDWAWVANDFRHQEGMINCWQNKTAEDRQRAVRTIAHRGQRKPALCAQTYPVACCVHTR